MEISDLKSAATLLPKHYTISNLLGISNEMLGILVAQGTAKLLKVKFGGLKKSYTHAEQDVLCIKNAIGKTIFSDLP